MQSQEQVGDDGDDSNLGTQFELFEAMINSRNASKNGITSLTDGQKGCFWWKIPPVVDKIMHVSVLKPGTCKSY